jgi:hypothetical protein
MTSSRTYPQPGLAQYSSGIAKGHLSLIATGRSTGKSMMGVYSALIQWRDFYLSEEKITKRKFSVNAGRSKPWDSPYGQGDPAAARETKVDLDSFPADRTVYLKPANLRDDFVSIEETIFPWIKEHNIRLQGHYQTCKNGQVMVDTFFFKRKKDAMFFKLVWG